MREYKRFLGAALLFSGLVAVVALAVPSCSKACPVAFSALSANCYQAQAVQAQVQYVAPVIATLVQPYVPTVTVPLIAAQAAPVVQQEVQAQYVQPQVQVQQRVMAPLVQQQASYAMPLVQAQAVVQHQVVRQQVVQAYAAPAVAVQKVVVPARQKVVIQQQRLGLLGRLRERRAERAAVRAPARQTIIIK